MTTPADRVLGPLLDALLAARSQPAADRFDDDVARAVAAGALPADLARQLRYWQRASVHEVTDHVRTVLPVVLPAALAAVTTAAGDAAASALSADDLWSSRPDDRAVEAREAAAHSPADVPASAEAVLSAPDVIVLPVTADDPAQRHDVDEADEDRSRHHARRRLFVAGLTSTA